MRWAEGRSNQQGEAQGEDMDEFVFESTKVLKRFVEQVNSLWKPVFGFDLPLQKVKSLAYDTTQHTPSIPIVRL
jgi:hypothetical protein